MTDKEAAKRPAVPMLTGRRNTVLRALIYIPLMLLVVTALLVSTPVGTHLLISLANQVVPNLQIHYQSGSLNDKFSLESFHYKSELVTIDSNKLSIDWQPLCLLSNSLCIKSLSTDNLTLAITPLKKSSSRKAERAQSQFINLPFELKLDSTSIEQLKLLVNEQEYLAKHLLLKANWHHEQLDIDQITIDTASITLPISNKQNIPKTALNVPPGSTDVNPSQSTELQQANTILPEVFIPLSLEVKQGAIKQLDITLGKHWQRLSHLNVVGNLEGNKLKLDNLMFDDKYLKAQLSGELNFIDSYPLALNLDLTPQQHQETQKLTLTSPQPASIVEQKFGVSDALLGEVATSPFWHSLSASTIKIKASNDLALIKLNAHLDDKHSISLKGELASLSSQLPYKLDLTHSKLDLTSISDALGQLNLPELSSHGDIHQQHISALGQINAQQQVPLKFKIDAIHNSNKQITINVAELGFLESQLAMQGKLAYQDTLSWDTRVDIKQLLASDLNKLANQYHKDAITLPSAAQQILTALNQSETQTKASPKNDDVGIVQLKGALSGGFHIAGGLATKGNTDKLKHQSKQSNSEPSKPYWYLKADDIALKGKLQDLPLSLTGNIELDSLYQAQSSGLRGELLGAKLKVTGTTSQAKKAQEQIVQNQTIQKLTDEKKSNQQLWQFNAKLLVPELSIWHPSFSGQIRASLDIGGSREDPQLVLSALATNMQFTDNAQRHVIDTLQAKGYYQPNAQHTFALSSKASDIRFSLKPRDDSGASPKTVHLTSLTSAVKGNAFKQKMGLHTFGDIKLDGAIYGELDKKNLWKGSVTQLSAAGQFGRWQLDSPVGIKWQQPKSRFTLSPFCLNNEQNSFCINQAYIDNTAATEYAGLALSASGNIDSSIGFWLPENLNWDGKLALDAQLNWFKHNRPQGDIKLNLTPGEIVFTQDNQPKVKFDYQSFNTSINLNSDQLTINANLTTPHATHGTSSLAIDLNQDKTIAGDIDVGSLDLSLLSGLVPQADKLAGQLSSQLTLSGNLSAPEVTGALTLENGMITSISNPTIVENLSLYSHITGKSAHIDARWLMGSGQAEMKGMLDWTDGEPKASLKLSGKDLTVYQPPTAILSVSPEIDLSLSPTNTHVQGKIAIDKGEITIAQLSDDAVPVSQDVVFEDSASSPQTAKVQSNVSSELEITINDQVSVKGLGLSAKLKGELSLEQQPNQPPLLFGDIQLINGQYRFFGQSLGINKGEFRFVGSTAEPNLYVEASREIKLEDVTAGVRITGTPSKPVITLFSSPEKDQAEILSYILKGKGLNSQTSDSNSYMLSAALGLTSQYGVGAISKVTSRATQLVERIGISQVQLESNDEGRVGISGYIGDDLMVKYAIGVFNPGYEMTVRYFLLSQLYLESVSGTLGQSLDIYYGFEL